MIIMYNILYLNIRYPTENDHSNSKKKILEVLLFDHDLNYVSVLLLVLEA